MQSELQGKLIEQRYVAEQPMRSIVIFNWRDSTHPQAGGAEKVTHEIARRWVQWGHRVELLCARYPGSAESAVHDGVHIVRRGLQHSVHLEAYRYYRRHLQGRCDLIIDEINTIPFFTPLYATEPVLMYCNQLAREVWFYESRFPLSVVGYLAEPFYLQPYRRTPVITISRSTKNDLQRLGLRGPYTTIPLSVDTAISTTFPSSSTKSTRWTLIFVGRVVPSKRVDQIVRSLAQLRRHNRIDAQLWIVGSWDERYRHALDKLCMELNVQAFVTFWGRVDTVEKERLLALAHVIVMTSIREGWGLVVTEANALGTPAIVYDVPGLRDSTIDGETGVICSTNTPQGMAHSIKEMYDDPQGYERYRHQAWLYAQSLNWEQTARVAWSAVEAALHREKRSLRRTN